MMFENLKIQIVEVFENEFKNRIQDFINDGCEIDNMILEGIAEELNERFNNMMKPIYNKYSSKYIYEKMKDLTIMNRIQPFRKFELYNKFYVNDDDLFDVLNL